VNINLKLSPYTKDYLLDTKTGKAYYQPTDPALVLRVVFGINQSDTLPRVNLSKLSGASSSGSISPPPYWGLYKTVNLGLVNMLQGAVYSWGKNASDQVQNTPTPSQYSAVYSEVSINGGPLSQSSATLHSVTTTEQLPMASTFNPNGPENYDVYMQGTWYDYIYHQYERGFFNGQVKEVFEMGQSGNWYKYDNWATSTSDYSFSYFENFAIGDQIKTL